MKIKTFEAQSTEDIDKLVNEFEAQHKVKATQSHIVVDGNTGMWFIYVLFYEE